MSIVRWWKRRWGKDHEDKAAPETREIGELREFVYLDENSLVSLIASRDGAIADEIKETSKSMLSAGASGGLAVGNNVISKANLGFDMSTSSTSGAETTFKLVAQSRFKAFYDSESANEAILSLAVLQPVERDDKGSLVVNDKNSLAVKDLRRGTLVEFEMTPEAERMFSVTTIFAEIASALDDTSLTPAEKKNLGAGFQNDAVFGMQLLKKLQLGLIPIEGYVPGLSVITVDHSNYVIQTPETDSPLVDPTYALRPLRIVAMAQSGNFWKDFRRVLYSKQPYRVLARLSGSTLLADWNTMPLVDVMKTLEGNAFEPLYAALDELRTSELNSTTVLDPASIQALRNMYEYYGLQLMKKCAPKKRDSKKLSDFIGKLDISGATAPEQSKAFQEITSFITKNYTPNEPLEGQTLHRLRAQARNKYSIGIDGIAVAETKSSIPVSNTTDESATVEVDLVAMYW